MGFSRRLFRKRFYNPLPRPTLEGRVQGLEHEYAIEFPEIESEDERDRYISGKISQIRTLSAPSGEESINLTWSFWRNLENGGVFYIDMGHLEGSTPECLDTRELIKQDRAMDLLALKVFGDEYTSLIYKMNRDSKVSFGAHQSFSIKFQPSEETLEPLLLWAVVEKIITGAGYQYPDGQYEVSQRRSFMQQAFSSDAREVGKGRGLLNTREETLTGLHGWHRFHNISNDANMCQSALAMKQELMRCVLALYEAKLLPKISYYTDINCDLAVKDLDHICCKHEDWTLEGTPADFRKVTSVLRTYEQVMRSELYGQDSFRNCVLDIFRDTIVKLERIKEEPYALAGRLDWVTKKYLIEKILGSDGLGFDNPLIQSITLDYHRIDPNGLFYQTLQDGWIEQLVSQKEAEDAMNTPPKTRAETRGRIVQKYGDGIFKDGSMLWLYWDTVLVTDKNDKAIWRRNLDDHRVPNNKIINELEDFLRFHNLV